MKIDTALGFVFIAAAIFGTVTVLFIVIGYLFGPKE